MLKELKTPNHSQQRSQPISKLAVSATENAKMQMILNRLKEELTGEVKSNPDLRQQLADAVEPQFTETRQTVEEVLVPTVENKILPIVETVKTEIIPIITKVETEILPTVQQNLDTEIARATAAEEALSERVTQTEKDLLDSINAETADRKSADRVILDKLDVETARAQAEEASLDRRLNDLKSETSLIAAELTYESEARIREDVALTNKLTAEIQRAEAEENRIETTLRSTLSSVESSLNNRIIGEELARTAADTNLTNSIENVSAQLTNKIEGEASERALAIEGITAQLATEIKTRMTEDNSIRVIIQEEAAITRSEESKLATRIDNVIEDLQLEDAKIRASLSEELVARTQADSDLSVSISTEAQIRENVDNAIIERLDAAESDIDALDTRTGTVESKVATLETESGKHAEKTYVDDELAKKVNVYDYNAAISNVYTKNEADSKFGFKTAVEKNAVDISTNMSSITTLTGRLDTAEDNITTLQDIVQNGDDSNANLRSAITTNANAIELLTNGTSADEVDSVKDLIKYVNDHGAEVTGINAAIQANATAISTETTLREDEDNKLYKYITDNTTSYRVFNQEDFNNLLTAENVGKTISYNNRIYLIKKQEKEAGTKPGVAPEVGQQLTHLYFNTEATPDFSSYADETDAPAFALAFQQGVTIFPAYAEGKGSMLIGTNMPLYSSFVYPAGSYGDLGPGWINWPETEVGSIIDGVWTFKGSGVTVSDVVNPERFIGFISTTPFERALGVEIIATPVGEVLSVNSHTGDVVLSKEDIGLSQVDNTPDSEKEVAYAERALKDAAGNEIAATYATSEQLTQEVEARGALADDFGTLEGVVSALRSEYDVTKTLAIDNLDAIGALDTRVGTVEGKISTLETESAKHAEKTYVESKIAAVKLTASLIDEDTLELSIAK